MKSHEDGLTEQEKEWFYALMQDRADNANTLEKPSMRGIQRSVVDKYSARRISSTSFAKRR